MTQGHVKRDESTERCRWWLYRSTSGQWHVADPDVWRVVGGVEVMPVRVSDEEQRTRALKAAGQVLGYVPRGELVAVVEAVLASASGGSPPGPRGEA